ncbi:PucR family transcriptional regulator [Chengkuizengella sediminis]|uniref:PucR family transcriptional regulator n=1 Tax=Chengkuizengella sediminis TaxID=1885917 RepID=UPI001389878B|nr:PucR family transcriptional regulator [Chengkuizengella sediminis]NDI35448.1 PucR family transcriptional regulator [Chengkuizengella sediminis]
MKDQFKLTITDILKRKYFNKASIIAGHTGLNRIVKWVHVVEVTNIRKLLNGQELILSTGLGWQENENLFISYIEQLIEADVSGLCIEMGTYTSKIPNKVVQIANEHHFPIILFLEEVPFVKITQDIHFLLVNHHYIEERRKAEENKWLRDWLDGIHSEEEIRDHLLEHNSEISKLKLQGGVVCIYKYKQDVTTKFDHHYFMMLSRTIFQQQGFIVFATEERNSVILLLVNIRHKHDWKIRIKSGMNNLLNSEFINKQNNLKSNIGVGKFKSQLSLMNECYQSALEAIKIKSRMPSRLDNQFYEELHMYRFILLLNKQSDLRETINEYLKPIIEYDRKHNGKLLETLRVYLACNGSKQETAKRLFIVRQTLYHRLNKLTDLLGKDFMNSDKRLAIEFMLMAYEFLDNPLSPTFIGEV